MDSELTAAQADLRMTMRIAGNVPYLSGCWIQRT